jgi:DNA invertase Pin-like site-specific DNA recombinase
MTMSVMNSNPSFPLLSGAGKIQRVHLDRVAIVYVRQSTLQQIERHRESTRLQYGLVERAIELGWAKQRVVIIDEDLGRSGATAEGRLGFQRLVAEVSLDHVGIVLGIEMSRLARSSRDWYQLLEVCALFSTLIGDVDGIYDPGSYNDRLLLGLKGTMSEAELHILKQRMLEGKKAKARRGELVLLLPMGYIRRPSGEVIKDPDEQVQAVIELVFEVFARRGTIHAVLRHLVKHAIELPHRVSSGPRKGELQWRRPNRVTLSNLLHNPAYAGAYAYGRRPTDPRRKRPGRPSTGRTVAPMEQWTVLLQDQWPGYIRWAQYEQNLEQLKANTAQSMGTPRRGPSLLSGLLICGRCGLRMATHYSNNGHCLRYSCSRMAVDYAAPYCQSLVGAPLDALLTEHVLQALEPAALEISLKVAEDLEHERAQHVALWQQRLERARYEVERAYRQYNAVEPENRLIARTLEKHWEQALEAEETLKMEYARFVAREPAVLSAEQREAIRRLSSDIPALWYAPTTPSADRQAIVRQLLDRVIVSVLDDTEQVNVELHWAGGHRTGTRLIRPVARLEQLSYYPQLKQRVKELHQQGLHAKAIADSLNTEGWRPAKRRETFNVLMVRSLLSRLGLSTGTAKQQHANSIERKLNEWTLKQLAGKLEMPESTLYVWLHRGKLNARQAKGPARTVWLVYADRKELVRLRQLRTESRLWPKKVPLNVQQPEKHT